jgi:hypothetical protein
MLTGSCLCGGVTISVAGPLEHPPEACHCTQCRKQTGSFLSGVNVRKAALTIHGEPLIGWYRSSDKVERGFCTVCGSTLFWKPNIEGYAWIGVAGGLFDQPLGAKLAKHTFVSEKGDYYDIADGAPQHDRF